MALKYVASNTTYDFGKSEYTTTSNKYKRLNYIANGKTYQIGLATDATATQYSPLKMKINDSTYYIGRSSSRSISTSSVSTYSSRYLARVNTYTHRYTASSIKTEYKYEVSMTNGRRTYDPRGIYDSSFYSGSYSCTSTFDKPQQRYIETSTRIVDDIHYSPAIGTEFYWGGSSFTYITSLAKTITYPESKIESSYEYSTTTVSSSASGVTSVASNNFV